MNMSLPIRTKGNAATKEFLRELQARLKIYLEVAILSTSIVAFSRNIQVKNN